MKTVILAIGKVRDSDGPTGHVANDLKEREDIVFHADVAP